MRRREKAERIGEILDELYPEPPIPLDHVDPYTLLVAVALSAQTTDKKVNQVDAGAVRRRRHAGEDGGARPGADPRRSSARSVWRRRRRRTSGLAANQIVDAGGEVLAGLGLPRVARRRRPQDGERRDGAGVRRAGVPRRHPHPSPRRALGPVDGTNVEQTERDLKAVFPRRRGTRRHLQIIYFGREYCPALRHDFAACPICSWAASKKRATAEVPKRRARKA